MDELRRQRPLDSSGFQFREESLPPPSQPPDYGEARRDCQTACTRRFKTHTHSTSSDRTGENRGRPRTRRRGCGWGVGANPRRERGYEGVVRKKRDSRAGSVSRALRRIKQFYNEMFRSMLKRDTGLPPSNGFWVCRKSSLPRSHRADESRCDRGST